MAVEDLLFACLCFAIAIFCIFKIIDDFFVVDEELKQNEKE